MLRRRAVAVVVTLLALAPLAVAEPAAAQVDRPLEIALSAGQIVSHRGCDGQPDVQASSVSIGVTRFGATTNPLTVSLTYSGSLVAGVDYDPLPPTLTIPAGSTNSNFVTAERLTSKAGTVHVDATAPGFDPISGESGTSALTLADCRVFPTAIRELPVGQPFEATLEDLFVDWDSAYADSIVSVSDGTLPPGVEYTSYAVAGTPTTVGRYEFAIQACLGICLIRMPVVLDVVDGSSPAPPAVEEPVSSPATSGSSGAATTAPTAPAAAPVGAVPALTG